MSARDTVLGKIRRSLHVTGTEPTRNATVDERLRRAPKGVIPARGQLPQEERIALFTKMAEKISSSVTRIASAAMLPESVADFLRAHNLPSALRMGDDPLLREQPWSRTPIDVKRGPSDGTDEVGLSHALTAVAESGTLVLTSGRDNPTTINFLPETHIVAVRAEDIVGDYETAFERIRARYGKGYLPRTVNFVTGPSRSGDIEQKILLGAHGPRRLHIIVIG